MKIQSLFLTFAVTFSTLLAKDSVLWQEEYNKVSVAFQKKKWSDVKSHGKNILENASDSPYASEIYFYLGAAYFHQKDYSLSNYYLTEFLKDSKAPKFFEEAIEYKFLIAEKYQNGAKKHLLGIEKLPKITPAWEDALALYDEVITTLPRHPIAAKALFNKAQMQKIEGKFSEAIESLQTLIKRFPKDPLAPKSYLAISEAYSDESKDLFPDRDFLEQARLNVKKFKKDFPQDEKVLEAEKLLSSMQNGYARDLWESANYFAKKKKVKSSILYYTSIIHKYPESKYASLALKKISELKVYYPQEVANASYQEIQQ
jgi:outer membrane protein assembly factor BamD (BamD/ComL family)